MPGRITRNVTCGQELGLDIRAPGVKGPSRAVAPVVLGLKPGPIETFDGAGLPAGWQVNPDGTDSATQGRWALGAPQRSLFFDYTLQPGAAFSGSGAMVTGPDRRADRQRRWQDHAGLGAVRGEGAARPPPVVPGVFRVGGLRSPRGQGGPGAGACGVDGGAGVAGRPDLDGDRPGGRDGQRLAAPARSAWRAAWPPVWPRPIRCASASSSRRRPTSRWWSRRCWTTSASTRRRRPARAPARGSSPTPDTSRRPARVVAAVAAAWAGAGRGGGLLAALGLLLLGVRWRRRRLPRGQ